MTKRILIVNVSEEPMEVLLENGDRFEVASGLFTECNNDRNIVELDGGDILLVNTGYAPTLVRTQAIAPKEEVLRRGEHLRSGSCVLCPA